MFEFIALNNEEMQLYCVYPDPFRVAFNVRMKGNIANLSTYDIVDTIHTAIQSHVINQQVYDIIENEIRSFTFLNQCFDQITENGTIEMHCAKTPQLYDLARFCTEMAQCLPNIESQLSQYYRTNIAFDKMPLPFATR